MVLENVSLSRGHSQKRNVIFTKFIPWIKYEIDLLVVQLEHVTFNLPKTNRQQPIIYSYEIALFTLRV